MIFLHDPPSQSTNDECLISLNNCLRDLIGFKTVFLNLLGSPHLSTAGANKLKQISNLGGNTGRIASEPWPKIDLVVFNLKKKKDN